MATLEIAKLSPAAADQYDRYVKERESRSSADKKARACKSKIEECLTAIETELGDFVMGELPDGRVIQISESTRKMKAQPARVDTWKTLQEVPTG